MGSMQMEQMFSCCAGRISGKACCEARAEQRSACAGAAVGGVRRLQGHARTCKRKAHNTALCIKEGMRCYANAKARGACTQRVTERAHCRGERPSEGLAPYMPSQHPSQGT